MGATFGSADAGKLKNMITYSNIIKLATSNPQSVLSTIFKNLRSLFINQFPDYSG
jgi:hypothetical protein